jgi:hypothetical protein
VTQHRVVINLKNRKAVVKSCILFIVIVLTFFCKVDAQRYYLFHSAVNKSCKDVDVYYLYSSINNKVVVRTYSSIIKPHDVLLASDSAVVKMINDSLYLIRPLYPDVSINLFIVNRQNNQKVDSVKSFCVGNPFSFSINATRRDPFFSKSIIEDMKVLFLEPIRQGCLRYTSDFTILSYELVLKRNDSAILAVMFKGKQLIGSSYKKKLKEVSKSGDGLFARNIVLKAKDGRKVKVDEYGLLKIQ